MLNTKQQQLVMDNIKLVHFVIKRMKLRPNEDIIQEGYLALCKAAERYDENKGKFSTFACSYIKNTILYYINYDSVVKPIKHKGNILEYSQVSEYNDDLQRRLNISENIICNVYYDEFFERLTEEEKLVIEKKIQKYKIKEIAEMLNQTVRNVYNKIYSVRKKFDEFSKEV